MTVNGVEEEAMGPVVRAGLVVAASLVLAAASAAADGIQAQPPAALESLAGTWEGAAQTPDGEAVLKAVFTVVDGKLSGVIESSLGPIAVGTAMLADAKLTIAFEYQGSPGTLTGTVQGSRIEGVWAVMDASGTFALSRRDERASDPISGDWEGEASVAGEVMPFSMSLRVSGEIVTGEISSAAGAVPITSGSWRDGVLALAFPYLAGEPVTMSGALKDGRLSGTVDYNRSEAVGTFSAVRKR
ncbi:MAG TPA: hypothetical protein PLN93_13910 [Vicinamibacterales bacterium]|nr:hypothetical protein [Vicinamibacterales bacterium]HPK73032.1 hypothetical protein [Vicinamibacterales bacterium]